MCSCHGLLGLRDIALTPAFNSGGQLTPTDPAAPVPLKTTRFFAGELQEWDQTNFLVDLAGQHANCEQLHRTGFIQVSGRTPAGQTISGFIDNVDGSRTDIDAVNGYIRSMVDEWTGSRTYDDMVSRCDAFEDGLV